MSGPEQTDADEFSEALLRDAVRRKLFDKGAANPMRIGRFAVLRRLGSGGMGVVYAGYDEDLDRRVAIKLLRSDREHSDGSARLQREAQTMARVSHPNVVQVYEVGTFGDRVFVAMEFIKGRTLREWLEGGHPRDAVVEAFVQAGRGLAAAHEVGVVHRDFKPDNVLVADTGRVCVLDFGLARPAEVGPTEPELARSNGKLRADTPLTRTGVLMGTPAYMSPEQHAGKGVDARSDQFSLCVAMWEALYGERPFAGETLTELASAVRRGEVRAPPPSSRVPPHLRRALERGLRSSVDERWPNMRALVAAIARDPTRTRNRWLAVVSLVGVTAGVAGMVARQREPACEPAPDRIAAISNDDTRARVRTAFGTAQAADAAERTLDDWAVAWTDAYDANCASLGVDETNAEAEVRETCLSFRLKQLAALLDVLGGLQPGEAANLGARWIDEVAHPSSCSRAFALSTPPLPNDPVLAAEVAALQFEAVRIHPLTAAGRIDEAVAAGEALLDRAREVDWPCIEALALTRLGNALVDRGREGDHRRAEELLLLASQAATSCGDRRLAIESNAILAQLLGGIQERTERGRDFANRALADLDAYGGDTALSDAIQFALAGIARNEGDVDGAAEHFSRMSVRTPIEVHVLAQAGRYDEALAILDAQVREPVGWLGPGPISAFEEMYWTSGRAMVALGRGDFSSAEAQLEQVRAVAEPGTEIAGDTEVELALLGARSGDSCETIDSVPRWSRMYGCIHQVAWHVSDVLLACGKLDDARAEFRRELDDCSSRFGPSHRGLAKPLTGIGKALLAEGMPEVARLPLGRAVAIVAEHRGPPANDAETRFAAAQAMWDGGGDPLAALTLALTALSGYANLSEGFAPQRREIEAWLATRVDSPPHHVAPPRASDGPPERCSTDSSRSARLEVINETEVSIDLYWVDHFCREHLYRTIGSGNSYRQASFRTHAWRLRDAVQGGVVVDVLPMVGDEEVRVTNALMRRAGLLPTRRGRPTNR